MLIEQRARRVYEKLAAKPAGREASIARTEAQTAQLLCSVGDDHLAHSRMRAAELWAAAAPAYAKPQTPATEDQDQATVLTGGAVQTDKTITP